MMMITTMGKKKSILSIQPQDMKSIHSYECEKINKK